MERHFFKEELGVTTDDPSSERDTTRRKTPGHILVARGRSGEEEEGRR
jgi:hypothetical protein